jgi:hypothetical protein
MFASMIELVATELRKIETTDGPAQVILECWQVGFIERREVMLLTGMDDETYKLARERILLRKKYLPPRLVAIVEDLLDRSA